MAHVKGGFAAELREGSLDLSHINDTIDSRAKTNHRLDFVQNWVDKSVLHTAIILDSIGVQRIADIEIQQGDFWAYYFIVAIYDTTGKVYFMHLNVDGIVMMIWVEYPEHKMLWVTTGPGLLNPPRWWEFWPHWLQCVLRVVFFGWIWMR